jgi:acylphosphatase
LYSRRSPSGRASYSVVCLQAHDLHLLRRLSVLFILEQENMEEEALVGVHVVVTGRVQGVGFRAFTEHHATQKKLNGWVRNCSDGTVEVEADGPRPVLETFLQVLEEGPPLSSVTKIIVDWKDSNRHTYGFTVLRS